MVEPLGLGYLILLAVLTVGFALGTLPNVIKTKVWPKLPFQNKRFFQTALTKIDVSRKLTLQK